MKPALQGRICLISSSGMLHKRWDRSGSRRPSTWGWRRKIWTRSRKKRENSCRDGTCCGCGRTEDQERSQHRTCWEVWKTWRTYLSRLVCYWKVTYFTHTQWTSFMHEHWSMELWLMSGLLLSFVLDWLDIYITKNINIYTNNNNKKILTWFFSVAPKALFLITFSFTIGFVSY